ncbi:MAG: bi-domain-containing oxidoreductase [Chloroflexi bacterium]|nr:bi-domain-containing oxidoreductase [Chloroflexota bacterium]
MKQVFFDGKGQVHLEDVPAPTCGHGEILVRVAYSLISSGTESMAAAGGGSLIKQAARRPDLVMRALRFGASQGYRAMFSLVRSASGQWFPTGYSAAGTVIEVGAGVAGFSVGDRVACAGAGYANHAEFVAVPHNLVVKVPDANSLKEASFTTLGAIALQGVRRAEPTIGETVVVAGTGLIGLLAVQILRANGCRVIATDLSEARLALARSLGVEHVVNAGGDPVKTVLQITGGDGADAVILTAGTKSSEPINQAFKMCRERGRVVVVGAVGMELERTDFYNKEIDLRISRSYGPGRYDRRYEEQGLDYPLGYVRWTENRNLSAFLDLVAEKRVGVTSLITDEFSIDDASAAYQKVLNGGPPTIGVLLTYPGADRDTVADKVYHLPTSLVTRHPTPDTRLGLALIGAGQFAKAVHMQNLKAMSAEVSVRAVVSGSGGGARQAAEALGAAVATTDYAEVLRDPSVAAVLIATRHNLHAAQCLAAAEAGKHIFVEKPLGLTVEECRAVAEAVEKAGVLLTVGFNRRFSRFSLAVKQALERVPGPRQIICRANAGPLPKTHWTLDPEEGGGRIIGEGCHFFDLMAYFVGAEPISITAQPAGDSPDDVAAVVRFADGSLGTLIYTGLGDPMFPKERIEIFAGGGVAVIDDFRAVTFSGLRGKSVRGGGQDKGHRALLAHFVSAARGREKLEITARDGLIATACAVAANASLKSGKTERVER